MRLLDLIGMILMIVGVNILLVAGSLSIITPIYIFKTFKFSIDFLIILFTIGALTFIIGLIIRAYDSITKDKIIAKQLDLVDNLISYLKSNKGKAFTLNALFQRIDKGSYIRTERKDVEKLFYKLLVVNKIRVELKDKKKFFMYIGES